MINDIKSFGIVKFIFSYLKERQKMNIILLNKKFQNKFGYSLDYYKKISGKIKIAEKNGKGKEYKDNNLIFEGEYLNGKKNGKGKEYMNNLIIFEGDYLNGKKNGQGTEYDHKDNNKVYFF